MTIAGTDISMDSAVSVVLAVILSRSWPLIQTVAACRSGFGQLGKKVLSLMPK
ncbi:MAG: hypothetical protein IPG67_04160 [Acidobacteria bacterium]|nr:hypothetical protein [Acidobacteriota bacterium]